MIEGFRPGSFADGAPVLKNQESMRPVAESIIYYSFVTLTTVGYGDIVPASATTRTLAWIEAIGGQFYLAVIVAGLVGMFGPSAQRRTDAGG